MNCSSRTCGLKVFILNYLKSFTREIPTSDFLAGLLRYLIASKQKATKNNDKL